MYLHGNREKSPEKIMEMCVYRRRVFLVVGGTELSRAALGSDEALEIERSDGVRGSSSSSSSSRRRSSSEDMRSVFGSRRG